MTTYLIALGVLQLLVLLLYLRAVTQALAAVARELVLLRSVVDRFDLKLAVRSTRWPAQMYFYPTDIAAAGPVTDDDDIGFALGKGRDRHGR